MERVQDFRQEAQKLQVKKGPGPLHRVVIYLDFVNQNHYQICVFDTQLTLIIVFIFSSIFAAQGWCCSSVAAV